MKKTESNEFAMRLIPSVMSILLCLGLLCTTSLAYFTETVTSGGNIIASASYSTRVFLQSIQQPASNGFNLSRPGPTEQITIPDNNIVTDTPVVDEDGNVVVDAGGGADQADPAIAAGGSMDTSSSQSNNPFDDGILEIDAQSGRMAEQEEQETETTDVGENDSSEEIVGQYTCEAEGTCLYTFKITAEGDAENGYCEIRVGNDVYRTVQIPVGKAITVDIVAEGGTVIEFTAQIGTFSGSGADDEETNDGLIGNGKVIEHYPGQAVELFGESEEGDSYDVTDGGDADDDFDDVTDGGDLDDNFDDVTNGGDLDDNFDDVTNGGDLDDDDDDDVIIDGGDADDDPDDVTDGGDPEGDSDDVTDGGDADDDSNDVTGSEPEGQNDNGPDAQADQGGDDIPTVDAAE